MPTGGHPDALPIRTLPGMRTSCALLTVLTILLAWPDPPQALGALVRPAYFALLAWFFWRASYASPELLGQPMRLVRGGFVILFVAFTTSAAIPLLGVTTSPSVVYVRDVCEHGAVFLLGTTLISYGLMLWIPQVIASHRLLEADRARQQGALQDAETERSALEQRLVEADRRAMLGELAASVAHDLRNPLTIVKGTAESLCRRDRSRAEIAEHTAVIQRNVDKADRTLEALIGLARPRLGAAERVEAPALLAEIQSLLHVEARRHHVRLEVDRACGQCPPWLGDRTLLSQALLNLALNAVQATATRGTVLLRARALRCRGADGVAFVIEDRGVGLPPEVRARLFTPFFTTKASGTGLGLSSCRRIAKELKGTLRLFPRRRGGCRAVLLLPRVTGDAPGRPIEDTAWSTITC